MQPWPCPTCHRRNVSAFCPDCGEHLPHAHDLTLVGMGRLVFQSFSAMDGQLIRSAWMLIWQPGELTVAFMRGRQKLFAGPIRVFLFANMLFFAMQSLTQTEIFGDTLASHMTTQDWSGVARALVARHLLANSITLDHYAPVFDQTVVLNAKSLIVLMVLPFTGMLSLIFLRAKSPFGLHLVFALHFYGFLMLALCGLVGIVAVDRAAGWGGMPALDKPLFVLTLLLCAVYLQIATGAAYGATFGMRVIGVAALTLTVGAMMSGYRFLIFLITLYTT